MIATEMTPKLLKLFEKLKEEAGQYHTGILVDIPSLVEQQDISPEEAELLLKYFEDDDELLLKQAFVLCRYDGKL